MADYQQDGRPDTPQEDRNKSYYRNGYGLLCGGKIPKAVWDQHKKARVLCDRQNGSMLSHQTMLCVVLMAGFNPANKPPVKTKGKKNVRRKD